MALDKLTDASGVVRFGGTISGPDIGGGVFVQDADPGAVGEGKVWIQTNVSVGHDLHVKVRNHANTGWVDVFRVAGDGSQVAYGPGTGENSITIPTAAGDVIVESSNGKVITDAALGTEIEAFFGSGNLLGFLGTAPIAQQVLATGAGHTVDDVITALQAYGLFAQA